jgi:ABC-type ATPase with predicted acetyltransferase domain
VIYDNLELEVNLGDVVYITGESGSGKSLLLRDLAAAMSEDFRVANITDVVLTDDPIIDQIGESFSDALGILNVAGLNDAYLFIRTPKELSDGQLYRFKVAKMIASGVDVLVADEFGAVLDRITAKVVAFNLQKMCRKQGKTLIVATTHTDMVSELAPSLIVEKMFKDRVLITQKEVE